MNVVQQAYPAVRQLYQTLEVDYNPLKLSERVKLQLDFLQTKDELLDYVSAIQEMSITRLIKQVGNYLRKV